MANSTCGRVSKRSTGKQKHHTHSSDFYLRTMAIPENLILSLFETISFYIKLFSTVDTNMKMLAKNNF